MSFRPQGEILSPDRGDCRPASAATPERPQAEGKISHCVRNDKRAVWLCLVLAWVLLGCDEKAAAPPPGPDALMQSLSRPLDTTGEVWIGGHRLVVELPENPEESARGLMCREAMADDHGMLFYYDRPEFLTFWMRNTRLPLSIAFIDATGRIDKILDMEPLNSDRRYFPEHKCVAALETNRGWFAVRGVAAGATVEYKLPVTYRKISLPTQ